MVKEVDPVYKYYMTKAYKGHRGKYPFVIYVETRLDMIRLIHFEKEFSGISGQEKGWARLAGKTMAKGKEQPSFGM
jgi:hypothetical protein